MPPRQVVLSVAKILMLAVEVDIKTVNVKHIHVSANLLL
jgi:hypothetical protein